MIPLDSALAIVVLELERAYGLGFVGPNGRIVTNFHVVANEKSITAHLADGRRLPVQAVCALDIKRDLAVLDVGLLDAAPVRPAGVRLAEDGQGVFLFGLVPREDRVRWVEGTLGTTQLIAPGVAVYTLHGEIPPDASGGPLVARDGSVLGIVTMAESDEGIIALGIPWKHIEPLMPLNQQLPLSALTRRRGPARQIPQHPLSLLEGSNMAGLEATTRAIAGAIEQGAPAYNEGDAEKCFKVYQQVARQLIDARTDCPGVQTALRDGLARAKGLTDADHRAWALRDAFDGLLSVIEKYMRTRLGLASAPNAGKGTLLN
ncbi:MAG: trypsin-like peptidase domain-containing protein [Myxococcaceae bacterium]|nr:trypsin-like peptidase domain-containing protein [Myxococcaceae bacterium]